MNLIINFSAREKGNCGAIAEFIKKRGDMVIPVSYTHLDVYKRQCRSSASLFKSNIR